MQEINQKHEHQRREEGDKVTAINLEQKFGFSEEGEFDNSSDRLEEMKQWLLDQGVSERDVDRITKHESAHGQTDHPGQGYYMAEVSKVTVNGRESIYAGGAYITNGEPRQITHDYLITTAPDDMGYGDRQRAGHLKINLKNLVETKAPGHSEPIDKHTLLEKKDTIINKIKPNL